MEDRLADRLDSLCGSRPVRLVPLAGGDIGSVIRADFADRPPVVVKRPGKGGEDTALVEAAMLSHLAAVSVLPVPQVVHTEPGLLLLEWLDGASGLSERAEADAGRHIARLHAVSAARFGFERDTVIGPLRQPNPPSADWLAFFRDHRLLHMARQAEAAEHLPVATRRRIEKLAETLDRWIVAPEAPELVHGDLWGGNILGRGDRVTGFIDPAIYYGHGEMDLAFITLFGSAGDAFFAAYREIRGIADGFFEFRRDLYNLWPLLVHVRLFGSAYVGRVERILDRLGA